MEENRLIEDVAQALENVRAQCPLIHNITNYVTVNDVANIVLAGHPPSWQMTLRRPATLPPLRGRWF